MLTISQIKHYATDAATIAEELMGIITRYTISVVDDPTRCEDAMFNTHTNEIIINLAALEPFQPLSSSALSTPASDPFTTRMRLILKIYFLIYHEMRHLYQVEAVRRYQVNKMLGGKELEPFESDKKCQLWLNEMSPDYEGDGIKDIEYDADEFAWYLLSFHPYPMELKKSSRRIGVFKRKYGKKVV